MSKRGAVKALDAAFKALADAETELCRTRHVEGDEIDWAADLAIRAHGLVCKARKLLRPSEGSS